MNGQSDVASISVGVQGGKVRVDFNDEGGNYLTVDPFAAAYLGMKLMQAAYGLDPEQLPQPPMHRFVYNGLALS